MIEKKTKSIGGKNYEVYELGAKKGRQVLTRLLRHLGPAVGAMGDTKGDAEAKTLAGLGKLVESLTEADVDYFCDTFAAVTSVEMEGRMPLLSDVFDLHFKADYLNMFKWLAFCLQVNFGSFLAGLGGPEGLAALAAKGGASISESPKT